MSTLLMNESDRMNKELKVESAWDKAAFATWVTAVFVIVAGSLALGLASWYW